MTLGPFDREHADAWSNEFVDVESLNAPVSDLILKAIDEVRDTSRRAPTSLRSHSLLVLGPAGAGKTHLFARVRRRCGPRAAFVLMRPELASDPTPRHVLAACMDALQQRVAGREDRQLDLVIGSALAMLEGHGVKWPNAFLEQLRQASTTERADLLAQAVERIGDLFPEANLDWVERLLSLPIVSAAERRAALVWLSGREPDANQLSRLGLTMMMPDNTVLPALRTLVFLASYSTPAVLVFDQLENLIEQEDPGASRIHAHARLVSELFDTVRGLVIVQMALDAEWVRRIRPALSGAELTRLEARPEILALPNERQRTALLEAWVNGLPPDQRRPLPWPFSAAEWAEWLKAPSATPRMLMIACRLATGRSDLVSDLVLPSGGLAAAAGEPEDHDSADRLGEQWADLKRKAQAELTAADEAGHPLDRERVLSALVAALGLLGTAKVEVGRPKSPFDLRVRGAQGAVDLFVVQHAHHRSAATALQRAHAAATAGRALALREQARPFPPTWTKVGEQLKSYLSHPTAGWLELPQSQLADLLALHDFLAAARSQDLSDERGAPLPEAEAREWARGSLAPASFPVLAAALGSAPTRADEADPPPLRQAEPAPAPTAPPRVAGAASPATAPPRSPGAPTDPVAEALFSLRLASTDRLVRELRALGPEYTRAVVLERVRALGPKVRWLGRSIVAWKGLEP